MERDEDRASVFLDSADEEAELAAGIEELTAMIEFGDITGGEDLAEGVRTLLQCEELDTNDPEQALFKAARDGDARLVRQYLNQGVSVDGYGFHRLGWSPLISAINAEKIETVKVLLEGGASLDWITDGQDTPYDHVMAKANENLQMWAVVTGFTLRLRPLDDVVLGYIGKSDHFYRSAKMLTDKGMYDVACFLCHQAVEMALHACTRLNGRWGRIHQLYGLLQGCAPALANNQKLVSAALNMQEHYIYSRYPADGMITRFWDYTKYKAEEAFRNATRIRKALRKAIVIHFEEQSKTDS